MDYIEWIKLLGLALQLIHRAEFYDKTEVVLHLMSSGEVVNFISPDSQPYLIVELKTREHNRKISGYTIIPWQNLYQKRLSPEMLPGIDNMLLTVTEHAIIFYQTAVPDPFAVTSIETLTKEENQYIQKFDNYLKQLFGYDENQRLIDLQDNYIIPQGLQVMDIKEYANYLVLEIAIRGTGRPVQDFISENPSIDKMVNVKLIPDMGPSQGTMALSAWCNK